MIALWLLAGLLAALLLALSVPVDLAFTLDTTAARRARLRISWLWGAVGGEPRASPRKKDPRAKQGRKRPFHVRALLTTPGFERRAIAMLRKLVRRLNARAQLRLELGLPDPAATGELFGLGQLLIRALELDAVQLSVRPHFDDERLELRGQGQMHAVPLVVLADLVRFTISPVTVRALRRGFARAP